MAHTLGSTLTERLADRLYAKQVEVLYDRSVVNLTGILFASSAVAAVLWQIAPRAALLSWLGLLFVGIGLQFGLTVRYRRVEAVARTDKVWERLFIAGTGTLGVLWGSGALFLLPDGYGLYTGFYLFWTAALGAASIATYSVRLGAFLAFSLPALAPYAVYVLARGDPAGLTLAGALLLFYLFIFVSALHTHWAFVRSLGLQFENVELIERLEAERRRAGQLNDELKADIEERLRTVEKLQAAKQQAEELAERLQLLSSQDGLTGIANRRHFDEAFDREWRRALRGRNPLSLVMVDIDFFKAYNDTYGHQAGDDCLKDVARLLKGYSRRAGDFAARYGGEEFAVVLTGARADTAQRIAKDIRQGVEALQIPHANSPAGDVVTVSVGVATVMPGQGSAARELLRLADEALYEAKRAGRNRVEERLAPVYGAAESG